MIFPMATDVITLQSEAIEGIQITVSGVIFDGNPSQSDLESAMIKVATGMQVCRFILGDLINYSKSRYGEKYDSWVEITGLDKRTLEGIAYTCANIPLAQRRGGVVTFEHHRALVKLSDAEREKWMDITEKKSLTVKRLRKSIEIGRIATKTDLSPPPATDSGYDTITPHVNRLTTTLNKKDREGEFDEMDAGQLLAILEDLEPVLIKVGEVIRRIEDFENEECCEEMDRILDRSQLPDFVSRRFCAAGLVEEDMGFGEIIETQGTALPDPNITEAR